MVISVVIPAYNAEKTISTTLDSVINQSYKDIEIIVIDDGSTDDTASLVTAVSDSRIRLLSFENGGLPTARNRGIEHSSGELISFIDADDVWANDKLEKQFNKLKGHEEIGVAYSWTSFIDEDNEVLYSGLGLNVVFEGNVYDEILKRNFIGNGSNILMRKALVDKVGYFDASLKSVEDWDYYIRLARATKFSCVPEYQIHYRKSVSSMTTKVDKMEHFSILVINRAYENAPPELQYLKKVSLSTIYNYLSKQLLSYDPFDTSALMIIRAFRKRLKALYFNPKIIFDQDFQRTNLKMFLIFLTPKWVSKTIWRITAPIFPRSELRSKAS